MINDRYGIITPDNSRQQQAITDETLPDRPTVAEIARWLRRNPKVIYKWAKAGMIPSRKVGRVYLFDKRALLEWAKPEKTV